MWRATIIILTSSSWLVAEAFHPRHLHRHHLHPHLRRRRPHLHCHPPPPRLHHHRQLFHRHLLQDHPLGHHPPLLHLRRNLHRPRRHPDHLHHHRRRRRHPLFHCHLCFPERGSSFCEVQRKGT